MNSEEYEGPRIADYEDYCNYVATKNMLAGTSQLFDWLKENEDKQLRWSAGTRRDRENRI